MVISDEYNIHTSRPCSSTVERLREDQGDTVQFCTRPITSRKEVSGNKQDVARRSALTMIRADDV